MSVSRGSICLRFDGSKFSESAMQAVIARGHTKDTEVRVLYVVEPPWLLVVGDMGGYDPPLEAVWEEETNQAQVLVAKTGETLCSHGMTVTTSVLQGDSQSTMIDAAEGWHADLIVLGSHGRKALSRFFDGQCFGGNCPPCALFR